MSTIPIILRVQCADSSLSLHNSPQLNIKFGDTLSPDFHFQRSFAGYSGIGTPRSITPNIRSTITMSNAFVICF